MIEILGIMALAAVIFYAAHLLALEVLKRYWRSEESRNNQIRIHFLNNPKKEAKND